MSYLGEMLQLSCAVRLWDASFNICVRCTYTRIRALVQHSTTVTAFSSCTKSVGGPSITDDRTSNCNPVFLVLGCMNDLTTERSFDSQATCVIDVLGLFFTYYQWVFEQPDMQTSDRLVQELNVCTKNLSRGLHDVKQ